MVLSREYRRAADSLIASVGKRFGERVDRIVLYGSKARGDDHFESDLDVLVILHGESDADWRDARELSFLAADVGLETGVDVSAKCISAVRYAREAAFEIGFARRVAAEGITLWPTA